MAKEENDIENDAAERKVEKPAKSDGSGLGLIPILGIVFGSLLIVILATRFLFLPYVVDNLGGEKKEKEEVKKEGSKVKEGPFAGIDRGLIKYVETGRITTNLLNSDKFIVINLGLKFFARDKETLNELFGGSSEKEIASLPPELMARIRGVLNQLLGSMTVAEIQLKRSELVPIFKDNLSKVFSDNNLVLGEVYLNEFIIQ